jgi:probable F420-dependent oxidoreductase
MRFTISLGTETQTHAPAFATGPSVMKLARGFEDAGYDACFVTDHPFPSTRFLEAGGHHGVEPLVALAFAAAVTTRVRLHTNVYVLPYRNPFLAASAVATLDALSGGRVILGVAAGYLKREFAALGVDPGERGALLDEALPIMKRAWTTDDIALEGRHFTATGNSMRPRPVSQPHPPIWMGGNSKHSIRRAVEHCQGWAPIVAPKEAGDATDRQAVRFADLERGITAARELAARTGRTEPLDICVSLLSPAPGSDAFSAAGARAQIEELAGLGVTWVGVRCAADTPEEYLEHARRFADDVVVPLRQEGAT